MRGVQSKLRGHNIYHTKDGWKYEDDDTPTVDNNRCCGYCGKQDTPEGHDGCLGTLEGVMNACCGHGDTSEAYVQFSKDEDIRGESALIWIESNKEKQK